MLNKPLSEAMGSYFDWLVSFVGEEWYGHRYTSLLEAMFHKEYYWSIDKDENRAEDGKALRVRYLGDFPEHLWSRDLLDGHCVSVLEVLIALAERCSDHVYRDGMVKTMPIFWFFVSNLGLSGCSEVNFSVKKMLEIDRALDDWMSPAVNKVNIFGERIYKNEELWWQMQHFLRKNPYFV